MSTGLKVGSRDLLGVASKPSGFCPTYHLRTTSCSSFLKALPNQAMFILLEMVCTFTTFSPGTPSTSPAPPPGKVLPTHQDSVQAHLLLRSLLVTRTVTSNPDAPGKTKIGLVVPDMAGEVGSRLLLNRHLELPILNNRSSYHVSCRVGGMSYHQVNVATRSVAKSKIIFPQTSYPLYLAGLEQNPGGPSSSSAITPLQKMSFPL